MKPFAYLLFLFTFSTALLAANEQELWAEILQPAQGELPAPYQESIEWREDLAAAMAEAKEQQRPLLVTWRCLPCKQCAEFDKTILEGSPSLDPLLKQFVTVRMTDAGQLDGRLFPYRDYQDLDLSWWCYFLSPEGRIYGVFGGKDHISDATRISEAAFVSNMERVLAHHYDPRREKWDIDGPLPDLAGPAQTPADVYGFANYKEERTYFQDQACIHCHQVKDILNNEAILKGEFTVQKYTQAWPFPENVGLVVDRDHGLSVTEVEAGSPAAKAGLKVGDELAMADRTRLFGQADFRGALHRAPYDDARILVGWNRDGQAHFGTLNLSEGWRESEYAWRKSVYEGIYGPHFGFFPIKGPNQGKGKMSFKPFMGPGNKAQENPWWDEGLRPNMEIVSINGRTDDWDSRELIAWFRLNHKEGDRLVIEVRQGGSTQKITGKVPTKH